MKILQIVEVPEKIINEFQQDNQINNLNYHEKIEYFLEEYYCDSYVLVKYLEKFNYLSELIFYNPFKNTEISKSESQLIELISEYNPAILIIYSKTLIENNFIKNLNYIPDLSIAIINYKLDNNPDLSDFRLILCNNPNYEDECKKFGATNFELFYPSFIPDQTDKSEEKIYDLIYYDYLDQNSNESIQILLSAGLLPLGTRGDLELAFFFETENLEEIPGGIVMYKKKYLDNINRYKAYKQSKMAINIPYNGFLSQSLFEAAGSGTLVFVFAKSIGNIFEGGKEIETFSSIKELEDKIYFYLNNQNKIKEISENAKKRTIENHSIEKRAEQVSKIISKLLPVKINYNIETFIEKKSLVFNQRSKQEIINLFTDFYPYLKDNEIFLLEYLDFLKTLELNPQTNNLYKIAIENKLVHSEVLNIFSAKFFHKLAKYSNLRDKSNNDIYLLSEKLLIINEGSKVNHNIETLKNINLDLLLSNKYYFSYNLNDIPESGKYMILFSNWDYSYLTEDIAIKINLNADQIWIPSEYVKRNYINSGIDPERLFIIRPVFIPEKSNLADKSEIKERFSFIYYGQLSKEKGTDILINSFEKAFSEDDNVRLVIIDESYNPTKDYKELIKIIRSNKMIDYYQISEIDNINEFIKKHDCFVYPYRAEGSGRNIIQAMSLKMTVMLTDKGISEEFCNDNNALLLKSVEQEHEEYITESGIKLDFGTILYEVEEDELAKKLRKVYNKELNLPELSNTAGEISNKYSLENNLKEISLTLEQLSDKLIIRENIESLKKEYSQKGAEYIRESDWQNAEKAYRKLIFLDNSDYDAFLKLGISQYKQNKYDEALDSLSVYLENEDPDREILKMIGECLNQTGDKETAEMYFQQAEEL